MNELFLILPVSLDYADTCLLYQNREIAITSADFFELIKRIESFNKTFCVEKYNAYYDSKNIEIFLELVDTDYLGRTLFLSDIRKFGSNWRDDKKQDASKCYRCNNLDIKDDVFCEIFERQNIDSENAHLLVSYKGVNTQSEQIKVYCEREERVISICELDIKQIFRWLSINRKPARKYNHNPKHGESGKSAYPSNRGNAVSVLKCTKEEAANLLRTAIGEQEKVLYNYDEQNQCYIEFREESKNTNTYHAFHLENSDESRVPKRVKEIINQLRS